LGDSVGLVGHTCFGIAVDFQSAESLERQLGPSMQTGKPIRPGDMRNFQVKPVMLVAAAAQPDHRESDLEPVVGRLAVFGKLPHLRHIVGRGRGQRKGCSRSQQPACFPKGPSTAWIL